MSYKVLDPAKRSITSITRPRTLIRRYLLYLLGFVSFSSCHPLNDKVESFKEGRSEIPVTFIKVDSLLKSAVEEAYIPGAVINISQNDSVLFRKAYGFAKLYDFEQSHIDHPIAMTNDHVFDLASLTKVFATTYGIMLLVDRGLLKFDDLISKYLPGFDEGPKAEITIRHLLTHTSGLPAWKPVYYHARSKRESQSFVAGVPLQSDPGQKRVYSDLGFMTLGYLIETVSQQSIDEYLTAKLYSPVDLISTSFNPDPAKNDFASTSHGNPFEKRMVADDEFGFLCDEDPIDFDGWREYVLTGEVNDGNSYYAHEGMAGHAGLFSTIDELNVLLNILLNDGKHKGNQIIKKSTIQEVMTMDEFGHGLGWAMSRGPIPLDQVPAGSFGHTGFTGTLAWGLPSSKLGVILLTNRQNVGVDSSGYYPSMTNLRKEILTDLVSSLSSVAENSEMQN